MDDVNFYCELMDTLRHISAQVERRIHPFCEEYKITPLQIKILVTLARNGPLKVSTLSKLNGIAGTNGSVLCKKMEKDGFLSRERDPEDERQVIVGLLAKGEALVDTFSKTCVCEQEILKNVMNEQEKAEIYKGVQTLMKVIERITPIEEELH